MKTLPFYDALKNAYEIVKRRSHIPPQVLEAYASGNMSPVTRNRIDQHLKTCEECKDTAAALRAFLGEPAESQASRPRRQATLKSKDFTPSRSGRGLFPQSTLAFASYARVQQEQPVAPQSSAILYEHANKVLAFTFAKDGKILVSISEDNSLVVWNLVKNIRICRMRCGPGFTGCMTVTPNAKKAVTLGKDNKLYFWDLVAGKRICARDSRQPQIVAAITSPDGRRLYLGSEDGILTMWDLNSYKLIKAVTLNQGGITGLAASGDGKHLYISCADGAVACITLPL